MNTLDESPSFEKDGIINQDDPFLEIHCEYAVSSIINSAGAEIHCLHLFNVDYVAALMEELSDLYEENSYTQIKIVERPRGKVITYVSSKFQKIVSYNRSNVADFVSIVMT